MNRLLFASALVLLPLAASAVTGNVDFAFGSRHLHENDWQPFEDQNTGGVLADFNFGGHSPFNLAVGSLASSEERRDARVTVVDVMVGAKVMPYDGIFGQDLFRPYLELGLLRSGVNVQVHHAKDDHDGDGGYYGALGGLFRPAPHLNVGFDLRTTQGLDAKLFGSRSSLDSFIGTVFVGFHWGADDRS